MDTKLFSINLSQKERADVKALNSEYSELKRNIAAHNRDAYLKRKKEIREELKTCPADQLLTLSSQLETLEASFDTARGALKGQLKKLSPRIAEVYTPLVNRSVERVDTLLAKAQKQFEQHFEPFGMQPKGSSPVVDTFQQHKETLLTTKETLVQRARTLSTPTDPSQILPYLLIDDNEGLL